MTDSTASNVRIGFEQCTDDGPFDEAAWATDGHHEPSRALLLCLARAIHCDTGYDHSEVADLLATVRWSKGYVGEHPSKYDYLPCDEDGTCLTDCDEDGNEITLAHVKPTTWGIVKLDAPSRRLVGRKGTGAIPRSETQERGESDGC